MRTDRPVGRAGFTLLEVMIALAIAAVGIVRCLQAFSGSLDLQDRASRNTRAVLYARAAMDALLFEPMIRNHEQTRPPTREGFVLHVLVRDAGRDEGVDRRTFEEDSDYNLRYLQVDVTWQEARGEKTYTLRSMRVAPTDDE